MSSWLSLSVCYPGIQTWAPAKWCLSAVWVMACRRRGGGLWYLSQGPEDCTWTTSAVNTHWRRRAMRGNVWRKQKHRWYICSMYGRCSHILMSPNMLPSFHSPAAPGWGGGGARQRGRGGPIPPPVPFHRELLQETTNTSLWASLTCSGDRMIDDPQPANFSGISFSPYDSSLNLFSVCRWTGG